MRKMLNYLNYACLVVAMMLPQAVVAQTPEKENLITRFTEPFGLPITEETLPELYHLLADEGYNAAIIAKILCEIAPTRSIEIIRKFMDEPDDNWPEEAFLSKIVTRLALAKQEYTLKRTMLQQRFREQLVEEFQEITGVSIITMPLHVDRAMEMRLVFVGEERMVRDLYIWDRENGIMFRVKALIDLGTETLPYRAIVMLENNDQEIILSNPVAESILMLLKGGSELIDRTGIYVIRR